MFKVKKEEYVNKTFRLPMELVRKMELLAQREEVSLNNLVIQCCQYALDHTEEPRDADEKYYIPVKRDTREEL